MTDLPAERLHEVMAPVWKKHPETRPKIMWFEGADWRYHDGGSEAILGNEAATLLCESGMVRWLLGRGQPASADIYRCTSGEISVESGEQRDTLVEALAAACMAVPQEKT